MEDRTAELVRKAQGGDRDAFAELVRLYARLVWTVAAAETRDPAWTEDLVQETFLRAWRSIADLGSPTAFKAWLLSIARRLSFRHRELSARLVPLEGDPAAAPLPSAREIAREEASERARERVHSALARLPERERLPVALRYLAGMDYAQISEELQMSDGALRGLLNRGVKRLRRELEPAWKEWKEE